MNTATCVRTLDRTIGDKTDGETTVGWQQWLKDVRASVFVLRNFRKPFKYYCSTSSFDSALQTDVNLSGTNSPDIFTVTVGSLATKLYGMQTSSVTRDAHSNIYTFLLNPSYLNAN